VKLLTEPERLTKRVLEEILGLCPAPHHLGEEPTKTCLTRNENPLDLLSGKRRRQMGDPAVLPALGFSGPGLELLSCFAHCQYRCRSSTQRDTNY